MRSAAFRATIGAIAWIALGVAAFLLFRSEQHIAQLTASLRAFDQHAREAAVGLTEARVAQQAYVATGQGIGFWMPKVTSNAEAAQAALTQLRESAGAGAQTPLEQAAASTIEFTNVEKRVRDYLKSSQLLMAGDVIFTEGAAAAATAGEQLDTARTAEHQAVDGEVADVRKQQALIAAGAASLAGLIVLLLVPTPRRPATSERAETEPSIASLRTSAPPPARADSRSAPAPSSNSSAAGATLKIAASLATDFGRVRDLDDLRRLLGRAADAMDASGVMVWMGSTAGGDLRPVLAHGYSTDLLARMPAVPRSADNAAAAAYRSATLQIVLARPGKSIGAVVAPILSPDGCIGALSAEIRHGAETSEAIQALAEIAAAHLGGVLSISPAEITEPKAAQG
jgi:hypothetical protein